MKKFFFASDFSFVVKGKGTFSLYVKSNSRRTSILGFIKKREPEFPFSFVSYVLCLESNVQTEVETDITVEGNA